MQDTDARRVHECGHIPWGANTALLLAIHRLAMDFRIPIGSRAIRKLSPSALNFRIADDPEADGDKLVSQDQCPMPAQILAR